MGAKENTSKTTIAILLVLVVLLASTTSYYSSSLASAKTEVTSLQKSTAGLRDTNDKLEQALSIVQSQQNASAANLNTVWIYDNSNRSVVTIQGSKIVTALTLFDLNSLTYNTPTKQ